MKRFIALLPLFALVLMGAAVGSAGTWVFRVRADQTTANTAIAEFKNAAGTTVSSVDVEGDLAARDITATGTVTQGAAISGTTLAAIKGTMVWTSAATDLGSYADAESRVQAWALAGVSPGDRVYLSKVSGCLAADAGTFNAVPDGLVFSCYVKMAGQISCDITNDSGGAIDPQAACLYTFVIDDLT